MIECILKLDLHKKTVINGGKKYSYDHTVFELHKNWTHKQDTNPTTRHPFNILTKEVLND